MASGPGVMEVIYDLMPLDILIEKKASEIMARIDNQIQSTWSGLGKVKKKGLIARWRCAAPKICNNVLESDRIPTKIVRNRNFTVHDPDNSRTKYKEAVGVISYTDGSVFKNKTGCGVHTVHGNRVIYNGNFYLGNTTTVFQAEVTAIKKSAQMLLDRGWENKSITFYSDSQASLAALNKLTIKSDTVEKCLNTLNDLGNKNKVHLRWVKAHVGIPGNETADFLAKRGSSLGDGPSNELLTPKVRQRNEIKNFFYNKWAKAWKLYDHARQTKIWFPTMDPKKSSQLLKMKRDNLSRLVQFFTGHNKLKRHKNIQNNVIDMYSCRLCEEEEESSFHVIAECPAMRIFRTGAFKLPIPTVLPNPPDWEISQIEKFLNESPVGNMLVQDKYT